MFRTFILNPNGITDGVGGHHLKMAAKPVISEDSGDFTENYQFGFGWFNLVLIGVLFTHCFPKCFPIFLTLNVRQ